ncbi:hypothetical protein SBI67_21905, partial [Mycolicibacterium sp. 120266]|uniref:hypothetical protein n=1 Tax=Mycolicibacterium sp. 120266 TaxID=3090601 RepID=UPI00299DD389
MLSVALTGIWLWGGSEGRNQAISALVGFLVAILFPQLITLFRGGAATSQSSGDHPWRHIVMMTLPACVVTWILVASLQAYQPAAVDKVDSVSLSQPYPSGQSMMASVVRSGDAYYAVGWFAGDTADAIRVVADGKRGSTAAIWRSTDGQNWQPVDLEKSVIGQVSLANGMYAESDIAAVRRADDGILLFGQEQQIDGSCTGMVWRLRTGKDFIERAADILTKLPPATKYFSYDHDDSTQVVAGTSNSGDTSIWVRRAGGTWSEKSLGPGSIVQVESVRHINGQWIAVGFGQVLRRGVRGRRVILRCDGSGGQCCGGGLLF